MARHRSHRRTFFIARIWLVVVLLLLVLPEIWLYYAVPENYPRRREMFGAMIVNTVWCCALLGATWYRVRWPRIVMVILLLFACIGGLLAVGEVTTAPGASGLLMFVTAMWLFTRVAAALILIFMPSINKLTSVAYI